MTLPGDEIIWTETESFMDFISDISPFFFYVDVDVGAMHILSPYLIVISISMFHQPTISAIRFESTSMKLNLQQKSNLARGAAADQQICQWQLWDFSIVCKALHRQARNLHQVSGSSGSSKVGCGSFADVPLWYWYCWVFMLAIFFQA